MSTGRHTEGEWHVDRQSPYNAICIKPYPGQIVCDICPVDEAEANAHLIAAAPEMLEALMLFINAESGNGWSQLKEDCIERIAFERAKAAVAKARAA